MKQNARRWASLIAVLAVAAIAAFALHAWRPSIPPIQPPAPESFDSGLIERGARLAAIGNCATCHTAAHFAPYAGGVAMATPFGTLFSTNITPEPETGIGTWSEPAFRRALHAGIARDGKHLYPAFPYDHFTHLTDDDVKALYAFLMTRTPVVAPARSNDLRFPLGFRPLVAGWNLLYLDKGPIPVDAAQSVQWNRGAYLVGGPAHCSACHSPRNALGAEDKRQYLSGGEAEGWYAPALNGKSPSPLPWTVEQLTAYLSTGLAADHAMAGGPMQDVADNLRHADKKDVQAIAVYIKSIMGASSSQQQAAARGSLSRAAAGALSQVHPAAAGKEDEGLMKLGASIYAGACASCHDRGRQLSSSGALPLPLAIAVYEPDARNLIHIIREGITPPAGQKGRTMPGFAAILTDDQLLALLAYLRRYAADAPPWPGLAATVQKAKSP